MSGLWVAQFQEAVHSGFQPVSPVETETHSQGSISDEHLSALTNYLTA
jgi:hypothetical protein